MLRLRKFRQPQTTRRIVCKGRVPRSPQNWRPMPSSNRRTQGFRILGSTSELMEQMRNLTDDLNGYWPKPQGSWSVTRYYEPFFAFLELPVGVKPTSQAYETRASSSMLRKHLVSMVRFELTLSTPQDSASADWATWTCVLFISLE